MSEREERAALDIQTHFRSYLARRFYAQKLFTLFQEDEERRREKEKVQLLEGEILLEKHRLRYNIADSKTLNHNEERRLSMMATRIQQAWKKHKNKMIHVHHSEEIAQASISLDIHSNRTSTTEETRGNAPLNRHQMETTAQNSVSIVPHNSSITAGTDCAYKEKYPQHLRDTETGLNDDLSTSMSVSEVRLLASQVNSILSQDDSTEFEMFESPEGTLFDGVNIEIQSKSKTLSEPEASETLEAQTPNTHNISAQLPSTSRVISSQFNNTTAQDVRPEDVSSLSKMAPVGSHDVLPTETVKDSSVKWIEHAFKTSTSHDQLPMSMKMLDENSLNQEASSSEDKYRLCYTIELSDSSSEEADTDARTQTSVEGINLHVPGVPGSVGANLDRNTFMNDHHFHELEFGDFISDESSVLQQHELNHSSCSQYTRPVDQFKQLDHSTSPLFTMSVGQLRGLFLSLQQQLSDCSAILIEVLEERDTLKNENKLLKENTAQLTRRVQSLYTTS